MASEKQAAFVRSLFEQIEALVEPHAEEPFARGLLDRVATVQSVIVACLTNDPIAIDSIDRAEVSDAIETLMAVKDEARKLRENLTMPPGIAATSPERVIPNRFAKDCACGVEVLAEAGWAVLHRGRWETWCPECAVLSPEDRSIRVESLAECQRLANERQAAAEAQFDALADQLWSRSQLVSAQRGRNVGVAVPDSTGRNDLRFYRVTQREGDDRARVFEVIGGRSDTALDLEPATAVLTTIVAVPDLLAAMIEFGRELGQCGRCGETLTKEESRQRGIGPVCARKVA